MPGAPVAIEETTKKLTESNPQKEKKIYDHNLVRTDSKEQKLEAFLKPKSNSLEKTLEKIGDEEK